MKTRTIALSLAAATALSLAPKPAYAGDKEWAAVGGLLGGLLIAAAIEDSHHNDCDRPATVVVAGPEACRPAGYWDEVCVRVWVPGFWVQERDCRGFIVSRFVSGHYEDRRNRVWVPYARAERGYRDARHDERRHDRREDWRDDRRDDRRDREVGYRHGNRR